MTTRDLHWLAGFIEGEGCFSVRGPALVDGHKYYSPILIVASADRDCIERVSKLWGRSIQTARKFGMCKGVRKQYKDSHSVSIAGGPAIGWMMTLYNLMSVRRKQRIRDVVTWWKNGTKIKPTFLQSRSK